MRVLRLSAVWQNVPSLKCAQHSLRPLPLGVDEMQREEKKDNRFWFWNVFCLGSSVSFQMAERQSDKSFHSITGVKHQGEPDLLPPVWCQSRPTNNLIQQIKRLIITLVVTRKWKSNQCNAIGALFPLMICLLRQMKGCHFQSCRSAH